MVLNYKNFDSLDPRGEFPLSPEGWQSLTIEYGYDSIGNAQYFHWRVKGTQHTFSKTVSAFNQKTGGDYAGYIEKFLESFRKELLQGVLDPESPEWLGEVVREYNSLIKI